MKKELPYQENWSEKRDREQAECEHKHWIQKCSHCGKILSCEKLHEEPEDIIEIFINSD